MGKLQMQIAAARKKNEREKDDDIERLSRVFNDEAKPTFVWQLDFAEIFHRSSRREEAHTSLLPDETRKEKEPHAGCYGFDLVLANPPYVRQEKFKELKPFLENAYDCYTGAADLYVYFYERAVKLLNSGGVLSFISSNKFFRAGYGGKLRKYLAEKTELQSAIDFGDLPIFEATAYPCIVVTSNRTPKAAHQVRTLNVNSMEELERFTGLAKSAAVPLPQAHFDEKSWQLESPAVMWLMEKLRREGKPLGEYVNKRFYRGITTGFNEAFVVDRATRDSFIKENKSSADFLKPFLRGRDVKRWQIESQDLWLIYIPWHFPLHDDTSITGASQKAEIEFKKRYPAIYNHLSKYKKELSGRNTVETGIRYEWYALQRCAAEYRPEFDQPKIILGRFMNKATFAYDKEKFYHNDALYMIAGSSEYVVAVLNSSVSWWFLTQICTDLQNGYLQAFRENLFQIPIPVASAAEQAALSGLVDGILAAKRTGDAATVTALEAEIDTQVFRLYALTPAEIALVKSTATK